MKNLLAGFILLPLTAIAIELEQLERMLSTAAEAQGVAYVEARNAIVELGTNAIPLLEPAAVDARLCWEQRLVARICCERITRNQDLQALLVHDWRSYPPYGGVLRPGQKWMSVTGPASEMEPYVLPKCRAAGLWYYYVELTWKRTGENPVLKPRPDRKFDQTWPEWCRKALTGQPEQRYLSLAMAQRLENDPTLENRENVDFYRELLKAKDADAIPVLIARYDAFNKREVPGPELFAGRHATLYRGMFEPLLSFADTRHVDLLEKFIDDHAALADLKPRLADVRARPAPEAKADPPFRLGTMPVRTP